jgi:hypothetical protein
MGRNNFLSSSSPDFLNSLLMHGMVHYTAQWPLSRRHLGRETPTILAKHGQVNHDLILIEIVN